MTISFEIICNFQGGRKETVNFYLGLPESGHHPIFFQSKWLNGERGGSVPDDVMKSLQDLYNTAKANNLDFTELCSFALQSATKNQRTVNKGGNGFATNRVGEEINKYAKEFLEQNGIKEVSENNQTTASENQVAKTEQTVTEIKKPQIIPKQNVKNVQSNQNNDTKNITEIKTSSEEKKEDDSTNNSSSSDNSSSSSGSSVYGEDSDLI